MTTFEPAALVARLGLSLRATARRLRIDPAMLCRPWSEVQADRYATSAGLHPGEVWPQWWNGTAMEGDGTAECARNHDEAPQVSPVSEPGLLAHTQVEEPMTMPKRGYTWAPFEPGHWRSLRHGARSPRKVAPLAAKLRSAVLEAAPWLGVPAFAAALAAWATAEAQCELLRAYIDEHGMLDDEGMPRPSLTTLNDAERRADRARQQLGLTPAAWASLARTLTVNPDSGVDVITALAAQGRQIEQARRTAHEADGRE